MTGTESGMTGTVPHERVALLLPRVNDCDMQSHTIRPLGVIALALIVGVFFTGQTIFMALAAGRPLFLEWDLWQELLYWLIWALLAPRVLLLAQRWPLD